jgi:hypothetical protein
VTALSGSCLCGRVRFEVTDPFQAVVACHCTSCKRLAGSVGTVSGRVETAAVRLLSGDELLRSYTAPGGTAKTFCLECGSNLFGAGWPASEFTSVRLAALDEPFDRPPELRIYVGSVAPWETLPDDDAVRFEGPAA